MDYAIFKLNFKTAVHLGEGGVLGISSATFMADTLFSALYIESLKLDDNEKLFEYVNNHKLCFSDAFPFKENGETTSYYLPKPMKQVKRKEQKTGDSSEKKLVKKIKYLPSDQIDKFLKGTAKLEELSKQDFYIFYESTKVCKRIGGNLDSQDREEPEPYRVGLCSFKDNCGLYVIVGFENQEVYNFIKRIFESLQFSGIGGKRSSGYGKFSLDIDNNCSNIKELLIRDSSTYMSISISLPQNEELPSVIEEATYSLIRRSGFVQSKNYAEESRRKFNKYLFSSGSCFKKKFEGSVLDVSSVKNSHPVYRYAIPMFIGV